MMIEEEQSGKTKPHKKGEDNGSSEVVNLKMIR